MACVLAQTSVRMADVELHDGLLGAEKHNLAAPLALFLPSLPAPQALALPIPRLV